MGPWSGRGSGAGGDARPRAFAGDLADVAPILLWLSDGEGHATVLNEQWLEFTGMQHAQAAGLGWLDAVHPDDRERRLGAERVAAAAGAPFDGELRLRRHDGAWRWMLERGVPVPSPEPGGVMYAGACLDITERRVEEQELLRSREDLRLALAAGHMGTWVWDRRTGRVTRDENLQALYGLPGERSDGGFDEWVQLVHPEDRERVVREVERALAEDGTYELEHRVVRPDGQLRWLARRGAVYHDDNGEIAGTRGLVVDITERKRAEEERNRLLAAEQEARREAERAASRVARLQAVTAGLSDARTTPDVADVIVLQGAEALEATSGALCLLAEGGDRLRVVRQVGYHVTSIQRYQTFSLEDPLPASEALRARKTVVLRSVEERDERYPALRGVPTRNVSFAVVPLLTGDRRLGALALGWPAERSFDDRDLAFLTVLAQQAAQALDRAQFYEAERDRAQRQAFLAEASRLLGSSLDYEQALAEVADLAVPAMGDVCSVHLLEDGALRTVAAAEVGDGDERRHLERHAWCFGAAELLDVATGGASRVVEPEGEDGEPGLRPDAAGAAGEVGEQLPCPSAAAVPLRGHDEALGVLVVGMCSKDRRLRPADVSTLEDLAARAATAISNSRSHRARTAIAHTLQHSLLPPDVPILPGLEVAARYRPLGDEVEVGGDFYDVFAAGGGRWGVVIGDVSGKGIPAASLTALARYTVRTAAASESGPSKILDVLNNSILDDGAGERFCTVALALIDHDSSGTRFSLACGGQPLPMLVDSHGDVRPVGQPGTAIGLFADPRLTDVSTTLGPEEVLVLYTDGVVEARAPSGAFADGLLEATLRSCAGRSAEAIADGIENALLDFVGGRPRDDTAILVIRRPPGMFHEHFAPGPRTVPRARQRLREWLGTQLPAAPELAGDILMMANELTTNAERAARAAVDVHVRVEPGQVTVDVSDDGPGFGGRLPPLPSPSDDAMGGRGMHIVSRLADQSIVRSGSRGTLIRCIRYRSHGPRRPRG
ncbi:MAG TPA: SpoIIE family protein phosphatase [Acidimicrobiales bacterium]|nr:SpoIIE family protein phosphatase [Acidimicrobiales bacterium]